MVASRRRLVDDQPTNFRFHPRMPLGRVSLAMVLSLLASLGCGGSSSEPKSDPTPKPSPPARIVIVAPPPKTTGAPWEPAGIFQVRVEDAAGKPVYGVHVRFSSASGVPGYTFSPADTTSTDSTGLAYAGVFFGERAGPDRVMASADGVSGPAMVDVVITPGEPRYLRTSQSEFQLFQAGDSVVFQTSVADGWQNPIPDASVSYLPSDPTLVSVTPSATPGGNAVVRSLKTGGPATIKATAGGAFAWLPVTVYSSPRSACTGIAAPQTLDLEVVTTVADSVFCIAANPSLTDYALVVFNASTDGATSLGTTVTAFNIDRSAQPARIPNTTLPLLSRFASPLRGGSAPTLDLGYHQRLLTRSRALRRLFAPARAARSLGRAGSVGRIRGPSYALSAAPVPAVDDLVSLNVADACTNADMRTFRVEAVGAKSIVLADTANPVGGFMRADYQRFASRFDTLVYPLDAGAFDAPSDIDGNGRVAILFTRAVNELTQANANAFIGGFFNPRDLFPRTQSPTVAACATSNEGEMFYMMVPDPTGAVNGNQFRLGFVDTLTTSILTHEFQHLINAGRRMYVNTSATNFEEVWLDEGLSHIAEELLYFREAGFAPRASLTASIVNDTWAHFSPWISDDASNFVRFFMYLSDPANHSPLDVGDDLETRGATWAFLRFAVDKSFNADVGVWQRFANSTTTGIGTLTYALQRDPRPLLKDFAAANRTGVHPSWDFNSVYSQVFVAAKYPVPFGKLQDGVAMPVAARGGSASYYRFAGPAGTQTLLRFGSSGAPANPNLTFMLIHEY